MRRFNEEWLWSRALDLLGLLILVWVFGQAYTLYIAPAKAPAPKAQFETAVLAPPPVVLDAEEPEEETEELASFERYALTESERAEICSVVMAEAGGEPYEGQMAVAQCILNAAEKFGVRPDLAIARSGYTKSRPSPSESVRAAVSAVFDDGLTVTPEKILYFYAPARCSSSWHESQTFVCEIGGHRFFSE